MRSTDHELLLLKAFNEREKQAFETLFCRYYATMCFYSNRIVGDMDAARDVVQEVFVTLWGKRIRFDSFYLLKSYLYTCVYRSSVKYLRKQSLHTRIDVDERMDVHLRVDPEPVNMQVRADLLEILFSAIDSLPPQCRHIFKLSYIERLEIKEIAAYLGIAEATVKSQRSRAKDILRGILQRYRFER